MFASFREAGTLLISQNQYLFISIMKTNTGFYIKYCITVSLYQLTIGIWENPFILHYKDSRKSWGFLPKELSLGTDYAVTPTLTCPPR